MALLVDKDGQAEGGPLHPPGREPELVPHRQEAAEDLQSVASSWLLENSDLIKVGWHGC